jgi:peptidylprolyl isomerase
MMKPLQAAGAVLALALCCLAAPIPGASQTMSELPDGLKYTDTKVGDGKIATAGRTVTVNYTGWLYSNGAKGKKFDSSVDRNEPFTFELGAKKVIPGWDEGVPGMRVGGKRTLIIPPDLAYGAHGAGGVIPPFATLIFDVELLKVE